MKTLLIADHDNEVLSDTTYRSITAAKNLNQPITLLVAGKNAWSVAEAAFNAEGVSDVLYIDGDPYSDQGPENMAALIARYAKDYSHVLAAATSRGRDFLPRAAGLCDMSLISDVTSIIGPRTFGRSISSGSFDSVEQSTAPIIFVTIRTSSFEASPSGGHAIMTEGIADEDLGQSLRIALEIIPSVRPDLVGARIVVSGGRGLGSAEAFQETLEPLADRLGAALGASRAAIDGGFAPIDYQVGQTGKIVSPELYIAVGISGAIQHLAGMKDSKIIVAINKDPEAPIFQVADFGLVADYRAAIPELIGLLREPKKPFQEPPAPIFSGPSGRE